MLLLLSNDDGVDAPGLRALVEALAAPGAEIVVSAPRMEQSGKSHALSLHEPLRVDALGDESIGGSVVRWHAVSGTPADCVYVGVHHLCGGRRPDAVVSGINRGTNLGDDAHYSGTVAAAMEGASFEIPALAVSLGTEERREGGPHWATAGGLARDTLAHLLADDPGPHVFLNLNVPDRPPGELAGVRVAPMGRRCYHPLVQTNRDPRGRAYYWIGGAHDRFDGWVDHPAQARGVEHTDGWWFERGWATLTPLHPDLTAYAALRRLQAWELGPR